MDALLEIGNIRVESNKIAMRTYFALPADIDINRDATLPSGIPLIPNTSDLNADFFSHQPCWNAGFHVLNILLIKSHVPGPAICGSFCDVAVKSITSKREKCVNSTAFYCYALYLFVTSTVNV